MRANYPGWTDGSPFLSAVVSSRKALGLFNYYNPDDFALHGSNFIAWEINNAIRPNAGYGYLGDKEIYDEQREGNPSMFFIGSAKNPVKVPFPAAVAGKSNSYTGRTYEIFSYGAQAWGKPVGTMSSVPGFSSWNLKADMGYDDSHYCHSRQMRSNIVDEVKYWSRVVKDTGFK